MTWYIWQERKARKQEEGSVLKSENTLRCKQEHLSPIKKGPPIRKVGEDGWTERKGRKCYHPPNQKEGMTGGRGGEGGKPARGTTSCELSQIQMNEKETRHRSSKQTKGDWAKRRRDGTIHLRSQPRGQSIVLDPMETTVTFT
jgi:hypothetical protein